MEGGLQAPVGRQEVADPQAEQGIVVRVQVIVGDKEPSEIEPGALVLIQEAVASEDPDFHVPFLAAGGLDGGGCEDEAQDETRGVA